MQRMCGSISVSLLCLHGMTCQLLWCCLPTDNLRAFGGSLYTLCSLLNVLIIHYKHMYIHSQIDNINADKNIIVSYMIIEQYR